MNPTNRELLTSSHWGTYWVDVDDDRVTALRDFGEDQDPSPIGQGIIDVLSGPTRITTPMVRKGWLEGGAGAAREKRGQEDFVAVTWDEVNQLLADELSRVRRDYGN